MTCASILLASLGFLSPWGPTPSALPDDALESRELAGIAEEQALLARQLKRLRQTMDVLVLRLEAEGRPRAVELLKEGIELLDDRAGSGRSLTLEESMDDARSRVESGQVVQSLESQAEVIQGLERLLAILMERGDLDGIEENLDRVREMKRVLDELASRERELRDETAELRENSSNAAQRELEADIARALEEERRLLAATERMGRESGSMELEQIEALLQELRADLEADRALLEAWRPQERTELAKAWDEVEAARRAEMRASRLEAGAQTLREVSRTARSASPEDAAELERQLEQALERADRHARASSDEAAEVVARALRRALEALQRARQEGDSASAQSAADEGAAELEATSEETRRAAQEARERASAALEPLVPEDSVAGLLARDVSSALERAAEAARTKAGDPRAQGAAEATEEAARDLRQGLEDLGRMAEALSGSQADLAREAERLARGLSSAAQGSTPEAREAGAELDRAASAMREASAGARRESPAEAREDATRAGEALEKAQAALEAARGKAASSTASETAAGQRALAKRVGELTSSAREGSMDAESSAAVEDRLREAERAMERAAGDIEAGKSASAAEAQRQALEALTRAQQASRDGVRPTTPEDRSRAEELAREQGRIREEILRLAKRDQEKKNPEASAGLDRARKSAAEAESELREGELDEAERSEREVERELERAREELEKEEEQYERLRQEELLFRITEELRSALASHREQMAATTEIAAVLRENDRPSRAQRLRLRRIAREEEVLAERSGKMALALEGEESAVSAEILRQIQSDLADIAAELSDDGDVLVTERVMALQRDVEERFEWLLESLAEEQRRREEENERGQEREQQEEEQTENRLVPPQAELKLLRRMEIEIQEAVERLLVLYPELGETDPSEVHPLILDEVMRLAVRHERTTELFRTFRARLGYPDPDETPAPGHPLPPAEEE